MWVGSDSSYFGVQCLLFHLECGQIRVIVDAGLSEQGDIFEPIVAFDNVVKIGMSFAADVFHSFEIKRRLWRVFGTTFRIDLAVFEDRFEPGKVFVVMSHDNLKVDRVQTCGRGGF